MATFFDAAKLTRFLRYPVTDPVSKESAELAKQVALGWLSAATDVDDWEPYAQDNRVATWVLELAGIAYENPTSMTADGAGEVSSAWQRDRRAQILERAQQWATRMNLRATTAPTSRGAFPPAAAWPDPARGRW